MEKRERINKLVALLNKCNHAYRTGDNSWFVENGLVPPTDKEYDNMLDDLAEMDPKNEFLILIGYEVADDNPERKEKLPVHMLSADKVHSVDEIWKWLSRNNIPPDAFAVLSAKMDGLSGLVKEAPEPGDRKKIKKAWTRGNGSVCQKIDAHIAAIEPNYIDNPFYSMGELIISRKNYKLHFEGKVNPRTNKLWGPARNIAAGRLNSDTPDQFMQYVDFIRFGLSNFDGTLIDKSEQMEEVNRLNKYPIRYRTVRFREITADLLAKLFKEWSVDYEIDGIVIDVDNADLRKHLGIHTSGKYPNYMIAYKDENEEIVEAPIDDVAIQISKNGHGIPVAIFNPPVSLDGANVTRATCHNMKTVVDLKIGRGAIVKIKRSGFVIPKIIDVTTPGDVDEILSRGCPICGSKMIWDEPNEKGEIVHLTCSNPECDGKKYKKLLSFFRTLGVDYVGPGIIDTIYNAGYTTVKDVINMTLEDFKHLDRFGENKARKIYDAIAAKMVSIPLSKLQHASGYFAGLGSKMLLPINQEINRNTPKEFITNPEHRTISKKQITSMDGFADKNANIYLNNIELFWEWVDNTGLLMQIDFFDDKPIKIDDMKNTLNGMGVVFTGFRNEEMSDDVIAHGGVMKSGVSKNADILVMKEKGSGTSKEKKAQDLELEILTIEEFKNIYLT